MDEMTITKRMLSKLREGKDEQARKAAEIFVKEEKENDNFINQARILMDEAVNKKKALTEENNEDNYGDSFEITEKTPQFGDVRTTQEDAIRKTINGNVQFSENALKSVTSVNVFPANDSSLVHVPLWVQFTLRMFGYFPS